MKRILTTGGGTNQKEVVALPETYSKLKQQEGSLDEDIG